VIGTEQRAFNNLNGRRGTYDGKNTQIGLTAFGPNINIIRDPRFGRNSELASEGEWARASTSACGGCSLVDGDRREQWNT
jgi:beta-glucosidase-like glycosyl hydrolase